ncbi:LOW QUALITY PROTEIN: hypothetical protein HID58_026212, partial [Brassica napus]
FMLHAGDEYLISTLIPFEPAQISFDPRECLHLLLILLNQPSFDDLVGLSASGIGVTELSKRGKRIFMISYQSECFFDGLLTLMSSLLNYHRRNIWSPHAVLLPRGEKKPAHSDNNDAPAVKLPTEIVEITSDPRTSEEDKVEMPADAYESTQKG